MRRDRLCECVQYAVSCCKYPTKGPGCENGSRSIYINLRNQFPGGFGSLFQSLYDANEETLVCCQIETKDALENVEKIAAIDGLDMCFIGTRTHNHASFILRSTQPALR